MPTWAVDAFTFAGLAVVLLFALSFAWAPAVSSLFLRVLARRLARDDRRDDPEPQRLLDLDEVWVPRGWLFLPPGLIAFGLAWWLVYA